MQARSTSNDLHLCSAHPKVPCRIRDNSEGFFCYQCHARKVFENQRRQRPSPSNEKNPTDSVLSVLDHAHAFAAAHNSVKEKKDRILTKISESCKKNIESRSFDSVSIRGGNYTRILFYSRLSNCFFVLTILRQNGRFVILRPAIIMTTVRRYILK